MKDKPIIESLIALLFAPLTFGGPIEVSVPGANFSTILDTAIDDNGAYTCEIAVIPILRSSIWGSSVLMIISNHDGSHVTQVIYSPADDKHLFTVAVVDNEDEDEKSYTHNDDFLLLNMVSNSSAIASITWRDDKLISFEGRDSEGQFASGQIVVSDQEFDRFKVNVSGVLGKISCYEVET
jgi:hypothetical protein